MSVGLLVVANAAAGSTEDAAVGAAVAVLRGGGPVELVRSASPQELDGALDALDGRALVVAGGDGSLHLAVARLRARGQLGDVAVGLVPLGTGNDFARGVGIPLEPSAAARALLSPDPRAVDLLVTDSGEVVVNAAHAGLGAAAARRSEKLKPRLGPVAYPLGALIAGVRETASALTVTLDGEVVSDRPTMMVGVCNGPSIGGGTLLAPGALLSDGLLDLVVVTATGLRARATFARALRAGTHLKRGDVAHHRGVRVEIAGTPVHHDLDGEITDRRRSASYRLEAGAWTLLNGP